LNMKILSLSIQDFRSLRDVCWRPGDLNVLIGPNGSGKTNLVVLLKLIAASAQARLAENIVKLGGIIPLVWDRRADGFGFQLQTTGVKPGSKRPGAELSYDCSIKAKGRADFFQINVEELRRASGRVAKGRRADELHYLVRRGGTAQILANSAMWIKFESESIPVDETVLSAYGKPPGSYPTISEFQSFLASWSIYDSVSFDSDSRAREAVVTRHATRVDPGGTNLINVLHTQSGDRQFKKNLNTAMRAAFGSEFEELEFSPAADQRVQLRLRWKSLENAVSAADLSAGTLQFLFLITVLSMPSPPPFIVIEEPERYLHPSMLPIVAEHAIDASLRSQVVFTTHSPQFLEAFGETRPTTTVLECREGRTHLATLTDERLEYWLEAYSMGRLFTSGILENEL
jgi:predicted ATPase